MANRNCAIEAICASGREVILVTSGAVGVGRQRLRTSVLMKSSMQDLKKKGHVTEADGKCAAAVGQSGLMSLYEMMSSQLDVQVAQLLVTDADFQNKAFRDQLKTTMKDLLAYGVLPVVNENDAISVRTAPYKDSGGIFWDNDSLAALISLEIEADLLIILSDVEGLYSGPPGHADSRLIHTYDRNMHDKTISFGEKSRVGRGGMSQKVEAAWTAAAAGVPVIITSGMRLGTIRSVMEGEHVGTLFRKESSDALAKAQATAREMAVAARNASRKLQAMSSAQRVALLEHVARALEEREDEILQVNAKDVEEAEAASLSPSLLNRLKLKPGKIAQLAAGIRAIAAMEEPIQALLSKTEVADGLVLEQRSAPLGVLLVIFESRPDALPQIAALAIRSGNGLLLKGGKEATRSNACLFQIIADVVSQHMGGPGLLALVASREGVDDLLTLDDVIDLVIPRGSNALVAHIQKSTRIPVLGHADGVCHVFVDDKCDMAMAKRIALDSKMDYPAACNALECLLVHQNLVSDGRLQQLMTHLTSNGVTVFGGPRAAKELSLSPAPKLKHEYSAPAMTLELVADTRAAIDYIHANGSGHTDGIVTSDAATAELFLNSVDSACVFHNASTRFSDGFRFGLGAEVGISTGRIHARGPVGVKGLLTTRWLLTGNGHIVNKDADIVYTHKPLPLD
eukprot:jgi/Mesvir1/11965/Mv00285-RA.1